MHERMKNQYISSWILFLIILVTVVNLYYKPRTTRSWTNNNLETAPLLPVVKKKAIDLISWNACPLHGFECPKEDESCDCAKLCINGNEFVSFRILENDEIYVFNQQLPPGTYCLPKGLEACDQRTSRIFYSLPGWICPTRNESFYSNGKLLACKHPDAANNDLNVLWDYLKNEVADDWKIDSYEMMMMNGGISELRFRCKCDSPDKNNRKLLNIIPFVCSSDFCVRDIKNPTPGMGWNGTKCLCGVYDHLNPLDETSPCVSEKTRFADDEKTFVGRVECTSETSWTKHSIFCPNDNENFLSFTTPFVESQYPKDFLDKIL